jgi:hypothetical protein
MRKIFMTIVFLCSLLANGFAQQEVSGSKAAADFIRINEAYADYKKLKMDIDYLLFPDYTATTPFENEKGVFMKENNNTYTELFGITSLNNSKVSLSVDKNEELMVVADPPKKTSIPGVIAFDTLLKICSSIQYAELDGNIKYYRLRFDNVVFSQYNEIDIYFDGGTFLLTKLNLYFREEVDANPDDKINLKEKPRLEITYSAIDTSPVFEVGQFSETHYIRIAGKKISCSSGYTKYQLINNKLS